MRLGTSLLALASLAAAALPAAAGADTTEAGPLRLVKLGDFSSPTYVATAPGDPSRLFVVQKAGVIRVVRDGVMLADPFLTVPGVATTNEQGLLSMAFAPDYATSGRLYVYYTDATACTSGACDVNVDEYVRGADGDHAGAKQRNLFTVTHRQADNHNGGTVAFGPDGLLYAAPGDGGTQGDPECDAQTPSSRLGKVLRVDASRSGTLTPEVYALGLRNPFRFSFDRFTGDLLIGDVGDVRWEEVDFLAAGSPPGANFGWNLFEGSVSHSSSCTGAPPFNPIAPAITYPHDGGTAITGGVVVRDTSVASLLGRYLYADFYAGDIHSAIVGAGGASEDAPTGLVVNQLSSFGQDAACRVYVTSLAGPVYRLESAAPAATGCQAVPQPAAGPPPTPPRDLVSPVLRNVRLSRTRFRVSSAATPGLARTRTPTGTILRYTLSEDSEVTLRFYRALPGRRVAGRCVVPTARVARARRCTRYPYRGKLVRRAVSAGRRLLRFSGRIGARALPPAAIA